MNWYTLEKYRIVFAEHLGDYCTDGLDNDKDGKADCLDDACVQREECK